MYIIIRKLYFFVKASVGFTCHSLLFPSGVDSLLKNFPDFKQNDTVIAVFGPTTAKAATDADLRVDIQAPKPNLPSMTAAIESYLEANS